MSKMNVNSKTFLFADMVVRVAMATKGATGTIVVTKTTVAIEDAEEAITRIGVVARVTVDNNRVVTVVATTRLLP